MEKPHYLSKDDLVEIETILNYHFKDISLLERALTHTSYANEMGLGSKHNERLEFLGDAVLEHCISWQLYQRFPDAREGDLTRMRSSLVNTESFARIARSIGLSQYIFLGKGEEGQGGRQRSSILSDLFEAVIAAVFLDGGFSAVEKSVAKIFKSSWSRVSYGGVKTQDNKTRLQELIQHKFEGERPIYTNVSSTGPSHAKLFVVAVTLPDGKSFEATGKSCKKAEQLAAAIALESMGEEAQY